MTGDQAIINALFEQHKSTYFSHQELEVIGKNQGSEIRRIVEDIYSYTNIGAANQDLDQSVREMRSALSNNYPWLTEGTLQQLSWMLLMTWK